MKKHKIETYNLTSVEVYKLVMSGEIGRFPRNFWDKPDSLNEASEITRYLIEDILRWSTRDIEENCTYEIFKDHMLGGMMYTLFGGAPFKSIDNAYPNKFKPWELKKCSYCGLWTHKSAIEAVSWLIEKKLKWSDDDVKNNLSLTIFKENGLRGMIQSLYSTNVFKAINDAYPNRFKPWELKASSVDNNFWNKENTKQACDWLFNEKLHWSIGDIKNKITRSVFEQNGLYGLIATKHKNSTYTLLKYVYPNEDWSMIQSKIKNI